MNYGAGEPYNVANAQIVATSAMAAAITWVTQYLTGLAARRTGGHRK
jgi:hypothetical protein